MNIQELIKQVGKPYQELDENGNYLGCFEPVYFLHPNSPRFKLPQNRSNYFRFAFLKITKLTKQIAKEKIQIGDIVVLEYPNKVLHIGVYLGDYKIIQTFKNSSLSINKIDLNNNRIIGIYRIENNLRKEI